MNRHFPSLMNTKSITKFRDLEPHNSTETTDKTEATVKEVKIKIKLKNHRTEHTAKYETAWCI